MFQIETRTIFQVKAQKPLDCLIKNQKIYCTLTLEKLHGMDNGAIFHRCFFSLFFIWKYLLFGKKKIKAKVVKKEGP